jgi:acyl carrier protein
MADLENSEIAEIRDLVYDYFSTECDIARDRISDETNVIEELDGDSLMLLSLLEVVRKKYALKIELKTLGRRLMKKPANTIGEITALTVAIVQNSDDVMNSPET